MPQAIPCLDTPTDRQCRGGAERKVFMNELLNFLGSNSFGTIQSIVGGISGLVGCPAPQVAGASTACPCRPRRCCQSCAAPTVAGAAEITYETTVTRFVDVPMKVINFCPGRVNANRCGCCCCHCCHGSGSGCGNGCGPLIPGCWAR